MIRWRTRCQPRFSQAADFAGVAQDGLGLREYLPIHGEDGKLLEGKVCLEARQHAIGQEAHKQASGEGKTGQKDAEQFFRTSTGRPNGRESGTRRRAQTGGRSSRPIALVLSGLGYPSGAPSPLAMRQKQYLYKYLLVPAYV